VKSIDRARWIAVAKARALMDTRGATDEDGLCALLAYVAEHPEDPAAEWCGNTSKRQRELFRKDWNAF
jgi:hypothetical protein